MILPADWASGALGYRFQDEGLLGLALTHRSAAGGNNERLEFLGDAVLGLVMSEALYASHPEADEGTLSRLRARLVRQETLEEVARELALGDLLRLGTGELRSGGHRRASILANALEALLGAVFLDGGWRVTQDVILKLMTSRLENLDSADDLRDPKTRLQEFLQGKGHALPTYDVERVSGSAHAQHFGVICRLATPGLEVRGEGASRRAAEQQAALQALRELGADG
ncbi:MAG: ribonuclease III [Gammaproteobacteria bacterium]|nr:ribonuclease III [Gammaproteobacteria bacterium]